MNSIAMMQALKDELENLFKDFKFTCCGNKKITFVLSVDGTPTEITEDILNAIENNSVLISNTLGSQKK